MLFVFLMAMAANAEPVVQYYLNDGTHKQYKFADVTDMQLENVSDYLLMTIHYKSANADVYPVSTVTKFEFRKDAFGVDLFTAYIFNKPKNYAINDLDSIVFEYLEINNNDMVLIPADTFWMGNTGEYGAGVSSTNDDERPAHKVKISKAFYMGKYEVTQKKYQAVMGTNPSKFKGENLPVTQVSWYDVVEFCNALSLQEGLTPCYTTSGTLDLKVSCNWEANGYRLPTEAEWEYACKAGTTTDIYNADLKDPDYFQLDPNLNKIGWYERNSGGKPHPVGQKQPNAFGLYDMIGNVWEWCWDWYQEDIYRFYALVDSITVDPKGSMRSYYIVIRGCSYDGDALICRSAQRGLEAASSGNPVVGFRIVRAVN